MNREGSIKLMVINLRSDTQTLPTEEMLDRMSHSPLGMMFWKTLQLKLEELLQRCLEKRLLYW